MFKAISVKHKGSRNKVKQYGTSDIKILDCPKSRRKQNLGHPVYFANFWPCKGQNSNFYPFYLYFFLLKKPPKLVTNYTSIPSSDLKKVMSSWSKDWRWFRFSIFYTTQYFSINGKTIQSQCLWTTWWHSTMLQLFQCEIHKWSYFKRKNCLKW